MLEILHFEYNQESIRFIIFVFLKKVEKSRYRRSRVGVLGSKDIFQFVVYGINFPEVIFVFSR